MQFRLKDTPVRDFEDRADPDAQPDSEYVYFGWRPPVVFDGQSRKNFDETWQRIDR